MEQSGWKYASYNRWLSNSRFTFSLRGTVTEIFFFAAHGTKRIIFSFTVIVVYSQCRITKYAKMHEAYHWIASRMMGSVHTTRANIFSMFTVIFAYQVHDNVRFPQGTISQYIGDPNTCVDTWS